MWACDSEYKFNRILCHWEENSKINFFFISFSFFTRPIAFTLCYVQSESHTRCLNVLFVCSRFVTRGKAPRWKMNGGLEGTNSWDCECVYCVIQKHLVNYKKSIRSLADSLSTPVKTHPDMTVLHWVKAVIQLYDHLVCGAV